MLESVLTCLHTPGYVDELLNEVDSSSVGGLFAVDKCEMGCLGCCPLGTNLAS